MDTHGVKTYASENQGMVHLKVKRRDKPISFKQNFLVYVQLPCSPCKLKMEPEVMTFVKITSSLLQWCPAWGSVWHWGGNFSEVYHFQAVFSSSEASRFWSKAAAGTLPENPKELQRDAVSKDEQKPVYVGGPGKWHTGNDIYIYNYICIERDSMYINIKFYAM